ncbi:hypothetical protein JAO71_00305 [Olleya sp. YSTF-M6]|uniref:Uncharacterized protein n=1 Tax=Olleya sediminilitoris TaxID=2795739 RepID=A0ABS1WGH2_9FLAO|nr:MULTISPECIES: hypothetical protein [Olleya]MBL7558225.1 hypothetical protein [Olleya sediminilitoris]
MKTTTSIFNLIEIFTKAKRNIAKAVNPQEHCEHKQLHDYYCDAELNKGIIDNSII